MSEKIKVSPIKRIKAELAVPGDKSLSHRAAILAGLAKGESHISNFLPSEDCLNTLNAMTSLGVTYEVTESTEAGPTAMTITGVNGQLKPPTGDIDCGNSGTGMRLLAGMLAAQPFEGTLTGDDSLSSRPMGRIIKPLEEMGANIETKGFKPGCAPLHITGGTLKPITYHMPVASAQVKSAVLLAGLFAKGEEGTNDENKTTVVQPATTRDHTERLCNYFDVRVRTEGKDGNTISTYGGQVPKARDFVIPGDISSAAFWIVAASCIPGSRLVIKNVGLNPTRTALLNVLVRMGAKIQDNVTHDEAGEPRGNITVTGAPLKGTTIKKEEIPNLIDEIPILAIAALFAEGTTSIRNASELRVKETDRIATVVDNLHEMGASFTEHEDGLEIEGGHPIHGANVKSYGDHRIAMAFAIAGLLAGSGDTIIEDTACIRTSYPNFTDHLQQIQKG